MEKVQTIKKILYKADVSEIFNESVLGILPAEYSNLEITYQSHSKILKIDWSEKC